MKEILCKLKYGYHPNDTEITFYKDGTFAYSKDHEVHAPRWKSDGEMLYVQYYGNPEWLSCNKSESDHKLTQNFMRTVAEIEFYEALDEKLDTE